MFVVGQSCQRKFCNGLKIKLTSQLGGTQQAGTPESAVK